MSDPFILQFVCKVNAENYSDLASSTQTQQNKKSSFIMLPVHELSKKKVVHCTPGGGGGGVQSLIKVRGPTVRLLPRAVQQLKCYLERTQNLIFGTLERTRYSILIIKLKHCDLESIKALKLDLERTKTLKNATMSGQKVSKMESTRC